MVSDLSINCSVPPSWSLVKEIQKNAEQYVKAHNVAYSFIEEIIMVATELTENAVKYGAPAPDGTRLSFSMSKEANCINVSVVNGINSTDDFEYLAGTIDKIHHASSVKNLYVNRMRELLDDPLQEKSRLGLFRVVYEGHCNIEYLLHQNVLTVTAQRRFN